MTQKIMKTKLRDTPQGEVFTFRIPEGTADYVEVTNFGAGIIKLAEMNLECNEESILSPLPAEQIGFPILTGGLSTELNQKAWDIIEEGFSSITFGTETTCGTKVEVKYSYINRNRLVCEIKAVPSFDRTVNIITNVPLNLENYEVSDFQVESMVDGLKAVKEFIDKNSTCHISYYTSASEYNAQSQGSSLTLSSKTSRELKEGEALYQTFMISADYIRPLEELECVYTNVDTFDNECIFENVDQFDKECIFENVDQLDKECIFENVDQFDKECIFENVDQLDNECIFEKVDQLGKECIFENVDQLDKECTFENVG